MQSMPPINWHHSSLSLQMLSINENLHFC
jgi:hypothetical protein